MSIAQDPALVWRNGFDLRRERGDRGQRGGVRLVSPFCLTKGRSRLSRLRRCHRGRDRRVERSGHLPLQHRRLDRRMFVARAGSEIVGFCANRRVGAGGASMVVKTETSNDRARAFYEKLGFGVNGVERNRSISPRSRCGACLVGSDRHGPLPRGPDSVMPDRCPNLDHRPGQRAGPQLPGDIPAIQLRPAPRCSPGLAGFPPHFVHGMHAEVTVEG